MIDYVNKGWHNDYDSKAKLIGMDCKDFKKMYDNLHPEVKKEFDYFLDKLYFMEAEEYLRFLDERENAPPKKLINIKSLSRLVHEEVSEFIKNLQAAQDATRKHNSGPYKARA